MTGVFLAIYMSSIWSVIWENAIDCGKPGKTLCIAVLVYLLSIFGLVWCTAYNFVPFGGEYSRERTYVVIGKFKEFSNILSNFDVSVKTIT